MKLYAFEINGKKRIGAELDGRIIDLAAAQSATGSGGLNMPDNLMTLINGGDSALNSAKAVLSAASTDKSLANASYAYAFDQVHILKPLERPGKIMGSGPNYRSHVGSTDVPDFTSFFVKLPQCLAGPGEPIYHPGNNITQNVDWEVEIGIVIGQDVPVTVTEDKILDSIFGYTVGNDVSARDIQRGFRNLTLGKNFIGFCPMGPCIVTKDEIADVTKLHVRCYVNGELMQDAENDWIFPLSRQLISIAQGVGFEAGDVVLNGTPGGNAGQHGDRWLKPGDVVKSEIDGIGFIENPVVAR
jgi:2,4-diketo-3-deoxy-L-fuconate hydrolase